MSIRNLPIEESDVVGSMLLDPCRIDEVVPIVNARDFSDARLRELFVVLVDIHEAEEPVNANTLVSRLKDSGRYQDVGGAAMLAALLGVGNPAAAAYNAKVVRKKSIVRQVRRTLSGAIEKAKNPNQCPSDLLDFVDSRMASLRALGVGDEAPVTHIAVAAKELVAEIDAAAEQCQHRGIRTGLQCFDQINGGFQNGTLNVIAGRPSNGKSVLAMQFAAGVSSGFEFSLLDDGNFYRTRQESIPTLFVSLEMTKEELAARSLASATEIDGRKVNSYRVTTQERARLRKAAAEMESLQLRMWEPPRATVSAIRAKARMQRRENGLGCLVVDYLQLIDSEYGVKHEKETYRIGETCRHLKQLAKELNIPVVVCCQLNRDAEGKEPTLSQLSDSGKIEQHADTVTAIHRMRGDSNEAKLLLLKWRNGQTPQIEVTFERQFCRFGELSPPEQPEGCYTEFAEYAT